MGATVIGRDLGPRVSSALHSGLTADCTQLEIGDFDMKVKEGDKLVDKHYEKQLYQIRPAFGGSIIATIVNPDHRPQMATVRDGVMKKEVREKKKKKIQEDKYKGFKQQIQKEVNVKLIEESKIQAIMIMISLFFSSRP